MFEKEAEERTEEKYVCAKHEIISLEAIGYKKGFKDGAEFGYNKAKEWNYPSKGEYPKEYKDIWICFLTEDDMKDCVRGWYEYDFENNKHIFKYLNVLGTQYLETVIAWKEIVLPEPMRSLNKEEQKNYTEAINKVYKSTGVKLFDKEGE